jgi:hypothetical protein
LQVPIAAVIDDKPALEDQPTMRFCCLWVCPCVASGADDRYGQTRCRQDPGTAGMWPHVRVC